MGKIKLLYISQATGGVQRHIISVFEKIDRQKFEVVAVCPSQDLIKGVSLNKESFVDAFKRIGVEVYAIKMHREIRPASDLSAFLKIYNFIRSRKFDIVHTHSSKAGFLGRIAARLAGVPVIIYTPHSFAFDRPNQMLFQKIVYILAEQFAGLFCDKVMAVCEGEKRLAVKSFVLPARKIEVVSNAVDLSLYNIKFDAYKKKEELGIKQTDRIVALVGRMTVQKAPFDFIKAALEIRKTFSGATFILLGDGPLSEGVKRFIYENGLLDFIKILGWRNDPKEIIALSDIFVLSSLWEALPNYSLLDAMALKKPIVTTDTLGSKELVVDGWNGFVVPKKNPLALAKAILNLLKLDNRDLEKYGLHSREILEKRPDLTKTVRIIEGLYERLLWIKRGIKV